MGDRRFRVAQTSFSDHPFSAETLLCERDSIGIQTNISQIAQIDIF